MSEGGECMLEWALLNMSRVLGDNDGGVVLVIGSARSRSEGLWIFQRYIVR